MESEIIHLHDKRVEHLVISMSAKIADAVDMIQKAKSITGCAEDLLLKTQLELEELFLSLPNP
ncbi:MAG: hypothetical protein LIO58_04785 [Oscillospiraceae bacterium]|nr:hypothetical protein [Oscillospiraceae bacterium]